MKTAIVILNWNGVDTLREYLPSVIKHSNIENCSIIVADNGSTDNSVDFVTNNFPTCSIVKLARNYGFAGGYNKALANIDADIFCLLNSDVMVTDNWLNPVLNKFEKGPDVVAIQPKILSFRDQSKFEHAGAAGGFIDKFGYPFCRGRIMDCIETDNGQYNSETEIFWASGACLFIRAKDFNKVGGFDIDYFAHMEEIDLCWRLKNQGHRILCCPESTVYHWGGATLDYNNPRKLYLNFRNSLYTLYKNYTGKHLNLIMFQRHIIDLAAIAKYALTFDFTNTKAVIKAISDYSKSKKELKEKRKTLTSKVKQAQHKEILNSSIVWQYFFMRKRKFSDL